ncbi:MAG: hypothetical protein WCO91_01150, partial [Gemmataceae bacterium]
GHMLEHDRVLILARHAEFLRQVAFADQHCADARDVLQHVVEIADAGGVLDLDDDEDFALGGVVPVIPSVALDPHGKWLNINADTAAAAVALALGAEKLVFLSDTPGILMDKSRPSTLIPTLDAKSCLDLMRRKIIDEGMIPKVEACLDALRGGVKKVHLVDGRSRHALMLEVFTDKGIGTEMVLGS